LPAGDIGGVLMVIGDYFWYGTLLDNKYIL